MAYRENKLLLRVRVGDPLALAEVANAIKGSGGNVQGSARVLKMGFRSLERILVRHPDLKKLLEDTRAAQPVGRHARV
jgi:hypothetical protein